MGTIRRRHSSEFEAQVALEAVKWEEVYLKDYQTVAEAVGGLERYFRFYNYERPHQALGYRTPAQVYGVAA